MVYIWVFLGTCLLHVMLYICSSTAYTGAMAGVFFMKELKIGEFASNSSHTKVKFTVSQKGSPDLPQWLRFEQDKHSTRPGFIYGTPTPTSPSYVNLEITAWDKEDYSVKRKEFSIYVNHSIGVLRYQAEFDVKNFNLDRFLSDNEPEKFRKKVEKLWQSAPIGIQVTQVESLLDRGGRVPVPPKKEGVFIAVGGTNEYNTLKSDLTDNNGCPGGLQPAPKKVFNPGNSWLIDWCKFKLVDKQAPKPTPNTTSAAVKFNAPFFNSTYSPPVLTAVARDFKNVFLVIIILPLIIVLIIAILLMCIMFGFRQGRQKRDQETPRSKIYHHDSILRTTFQLRQMSHENGNTNRGDANPERATPARDERPTHTSTPYGRSPANEEEPDGPRGAPPPYRMPPPASVNVSAPDGSNRYYPAHQQGDRPPAGRQRAPPFMNSSDFE